MKFADMLNKKEVESVQSSIKKRIIFESKSDSPEKLLRSAGLKIKLIAGTAFGTQFTLFKKPDEDEIKEILKGFKLKFSGNDVFVMDK